MVREAVALSGLEGLGVPRVLRFGRLPDSGRPFLVRELVEGQSLLELIEEGADPLRCLGAIAFAADQLTALHRASLLHGDIKPANIIVSDDGRGTLVDLGLAAPWKERGTRPEGLTPRYAAPELLAGAKLNVRAEIFALGATLGALLEHGGHRLPAKDRVALEKVVARATAKDPSSRFRARTSWPSSCAAWPRSRREKWGGTSTHLGPSWASNRRQWRSWRASKDYRREASSRWKVPSDRAERRSFGAWRGRSV